MGTRNKEAMRQRDGRAQKAIFKSAQIKNERKTRKKKKKTNKWCNNEQTNNRKKIQHRTHICVFEPNIDLKCCKQSLRIEKKNRFSCVHFSFQFPIEKCWCWHCLVGIFSQKTKWKMFACTYYFFFSRQISKSKRFPFYSISFVFTTECEMHCGSDFLKQNTTQNKWNEHEHKTVEMDANTQKKKK